MVKESGQFFCPACVHVIDRVKSLFESFSATSSGYYHNGWFQCGLLLHNQKRLGINCNQDWSKIWLAVGRGCWHYSQQFWLCIWQVSQQPKWRRELTPVVGTNSLIRLSVNNEVKQFIYISISRNFCFLFSSPFFLYFRKKLSDFDHLKTQIYLKTCFRFIGIVVFALSQIRQYSARKKALKDTFVKKDDFPYLLKS